MRSLVVLFCGLALFGCQGASVESAKNDLPEAYAKAVKLGLPMTAKDLAPEGRAPEGKNGAAFLAQFAALDSSQKTAAKSLADLRTGWPNVDWSKADSLIKSLKPSFDLIEVAVRAPTYKSNHDFDMGAMLSADSISNINAAAYLFSDRALLRASKGDIDGALEDIGNISSLASSAGLEPLFLGLLSEAACRSLQYSTAVAVAYLVRDNASNLERLDIAIDLEPMQPDLQAALRGEFYSGIATCRNLDQMGSLLAEPSVVPKSIDAKKLRRDSYPPDEEGKAYLARYLEFWLAFFEQTKDVTDPIQIGTIGDKLASEYQKKNDTSYSFIKKSVPTFFRACSSPTKSVALQRLALAHIKVLAHKAKSGALPANLAEAGVTVVDPFTNKPFGYTTSGQTFMVWSFGPDKADGGGKKGSDDIAFDFPPPVPSQ